ncbi:hypothetical protein [Pseudomonas aeruginosa]|uniref:hypothetical protein n=1 Tax=Pseudomonas aeruginosa TaxID=287 RepID=UPI00053D2838|nr:hypothetical protein [Pseudomonas aeruginosa]
MTDTTAEVQQEIFDQPLEGEDLQVINSLVEQHKGNAALTQQLALDASRVLASSQERLAKQTNAGFFNRLVSKVSGKTNENQLQNQVDMLQMQKFAWYYLKQLQQQNLINAQSIAVIRNNLGTMNEYIIETRDFLEQAVDKIDRRLVHVENHTSFNNWSLHIEANKRRFKSIPRNLLVLHLTYDFMNSHRDVALTSRDVNYLVVTLDKLGVNCDEEVRLLDFIIELIEGIEVAGITRYREMIELKFDEHVVDSHFIQKSISGIGFNALYFLSDQYERIVSLTDDADLCRSDEDRENIISKLFGEEFSGLSTHYEIRDLIGEVIGGSALAIDIYKDVNGLNAIPEELDDVEQPETLSLTSALPEIHAHSFFDSVNDDEERRSYLRMLGLCLDSSVALNNAGKEFLAHLAEKAGYSEILPEVTKLADSKQDAQESLLTLKSLLSDDDKTYAWLLDTFFLLTLCEKKIENPQVARILATLKPAQFRDNFPHMLTLLKETDESALLEAATKLAPQSRGWKNIIHYRALRFEQSFAETEKKLRTASAATVTLSVDLIQVVSKASEHSFYMEPFDDGIFSKVGSKVLASACAMGRSSALSSLNTVRKKACELISVHQTALSSANRAISGLKMAKIEFKSEISHSDYELDNSASNDNWHEQFCHYERQVSDTLDSFSDACSDADAQLGHFKAGKFEKSVVELKLQERAARELARQQERLEKQAVLIEVDGRPHRFSIEWQDIANPPCDPEEIREIKTDGKIWLIADNDGVLYRSEDGEYWQAVKPTPSGETLRIKKLDVINDVWILVPSYEKYFFYSSDALTWTQSQIPELPSTYGYSQTEDIVYFNGQWLWRFTERTEYSYIDKGILFDSTKTSHYDKALMYCADRLDGPWTQWEGTPRFAEGVEVECLRAIPGAPCLLMFNVYSSYYTSVKKKNDAAPFVSYYLSGKGWRNCTWDSDSIYFHNPVVTRMSGKLMCFYWGHYLSSDKGYDWKLQSSNMKVDCYFHLDRVSLFTSTSDAQRIYLSEDGDTFKEFMLEEGRWKYLCAKDNGALSVYEPNSHETLLRAGRVTCEPVE